MPHCAAFASIRFALSDVQRAATTKRRPVLRGIAALMHKDGDDFDFTSCCPLTARPTPTCLLRWSKATRLDWKLALRRVSRSLPFCPWQEPWLFYFDFVLAQGANTKSNKLYSLVQFASANIQWTTIHWMQVWGRLSKLVMPTKASAFMTQGIYSQCPFVSTQCS